MIDFEDGSRCMICCGGLLRKTTVDEVIRYKGQSKELNNLTAYLCIECGDGFFDKDSEEYMSEQFESLKRKVDNSETCLSPKV